MQKKKNEDIEIEQKLSDISRLESFDDQLKKLVKLQEDLGIKLPHTMEYTIQKKIFHITTGIHTLLQSKMMLKACVSAKRSCRWAAVAATLSFFGMLGAWAAVVVMVLIAVFGK